MLIHVDLNVTFLFVQRLTPCSRVELLADCDLEIFFLNAAKIEVAAVCLYVIFLLVNISCE